MNHVAAGESVYVGIANPRGESPLKDTTYLDEIQLETLVPHLPGLPVYIEHYTERKDGTPIPPCGSVIKGCIDPKTKELKVAFRIDDKSPLSGLAKDLLGENNIQIQHGSASKVQLPTLGELSLGYSIAFRPEPDGGKTPIANKVRELSICKKGARQNTIIKGRIVPRQEPPQKRPRPDESPAYTNTQFYRKLQRIKHLRNSTNKNGL